MQQLQSERAYVDSIPEHCPALVEQMLQERKKSKMHRFQQAFTRASTTARGSTKGNPFLFNMQLATVPQAG